MDRISGKKEFKNWDDEIKLAIKLGWRWFFTNRSF